jgi:hypothetical protein
VAGELPKGGLGVAVVGAPLRLKFSAKQERIDEGHADHFELYARLPSLGFPYAMEPEDVLPEPVVPVDPSHLVLVVL